MLQWLRVRLTGRAQKALQRLPDTARTSYDATKLALIARFDPETRQTRYQVELQTRRRKSTEGWADYADDLRTLADRAYPTLQEEARECLAINQYLTQLTQPQVAFGVRQKRPATIDEAVTATLEMESFLPQSSVSSTLPLEEEPKLVPVQSVSKVDDLSRAVEKLAEQLNELQLETLKSRDAPWQTGDVRERRARAQRRQFTGKCWNCSRTGHVARNCPHAPASQQGN